MKIENNYNNPSFGAKVNIKYKELQGLGEDVIEVAKKVKTKLEKKSNNLEFTISRAYNINPAPKDLELRTDIFIPTKKILIKAKKINVNTEEKIKNFFKLNFGKTTSTPTMSERALMRAANKAEKGAKNEKGENVFAFLADMLKPLDSFGSGPRP